jgi:rhodanese-related sulfurtransferase
MQESIYGQKVTAVPSHQFFFNYQHLLDDEETLVIDGRTRKMFTVGHLKNAINIDADDPDLIQLLRQQLEEPLIVVYCTTVRRTTDIVNTLRGMYDGEIIYISDGIRGWLRNGFPVYGISPLNPEAEQVLPVNEP